MSAKTTTGASKTPSQAAEAAKAGAEAAEKTAKTVADSAETGARTGAATAERAAQAAATAAETVARTGGDAAAKAAKTNTEAVTKAVKTNTESFDRMYATGRETFTKAFEAGNQAITQGFEQTLDFAREQVSRYYPDAARTFDEMAAVQKDNVKAFFAAQAAATRGAETIGEAIYAFNRKTIDASLETMTTLLGAKTLQDAVELQSGFARARFEETMAEGAKLSELTIKTSKEVAEPLSARVNATVEKAFKPLGV